MTKELIFFFFLQVYVLTLKPLKLQMLCFLQFKLDLLIVGQTLKIFKTFNNFNFIKYFKSEKLVPKINLKLHLWNFNLCYQFEIWHSIYLIYFTNPCKLFFSDEYNHVNQFTMHAMNSKSVYMHVVHRFILVNFGRVN